MIPDGLLEILERAKGFGPFTPTLAIVAMRRAWEFPVRPIARIGCCVSPQPNSHRHFRNLSATTVTGAKAGAGFEILLAPTRVWSIQPDCDRPG